MNDDAVWLPNDSALVSEISANLELRKPNELALATVAEAIEFGEGRELVCDLATGVGKTYLAAGLIDYLARSGVRNVLFVTPGTTIYEKTIGNFTPGHPKYVAGRTVEAVLITADNFQRGQVGDALHDPSKLKLFVFNVQQLIRPTAKTSRRTRNDDEYVGGALYDHLRDADDLVIIADEHHVYRTSAKAFSAAIRELDPRALVGLTATPDDADVNAGKIVFRYTLAEAIRDRLVKIPVIVYRQDGLADERTQLADACRLREDKEAVWHTYAESQGLPRVAPVLFVVCQEIKDAERAAGILAEFLPGDGQVLVITSESTDVALAELAAVEQADSPVRAIVSVNKLREGWDVRNIGVIVGLRKLASQTLTEQVLGRGLRLPFGRRVDIGAIDQVDLVAHESYKALLQNKSALLERLTVPSAPGLDSADVSVPGLPPARTPSLFEPTDDSGFAVTVAGVPGYMEGGSALDGLGDAELLVAQSFDATTAQAAADRQSVGQMMTPKPGAPAIMFPRRERQLEPVKFSVSSVDADDAKRAGRLFRNNLEVPLTRRALETALGVDGEIVGIDDVAVEGALGTQRYVTGSQVRADLVKRVVGMSLVPANLTERALVTELVDRFLAGAGVNDGDEADWTAPRASGAEAALAKLVDTAYAQNVRQVRYEWKPQTMTGERPRPAGVRQWFDWRATDDWYGGWDKSVVDAARFDSKTGEYAFAELIDKAASARWWMRIYQHGEAWLARPEGGKYYPDFIVVDTANVHWLVEVKGDDAAANDLDVRRKRELADDWAAAVRAARIFGTWRHLFVTESDIKNAPSWEALVSA